ncbi:hypothetical protein HYU11_02105 [Candidatus Woesearchaeota archaeon]|nr:hypothetical protein [Candidatus Woesearchaeota archaeon]
MEKRLLIILLLIVAILLHGCEEKQAALTEQAATSEKENLGQEPTQLPEQKTTGPEESIIGPGQCKGEQECASYCTENIFDCKAWCEATDTNRETCSKQGIQIGMPSGIPGSPCAADKDCYQGLVCISYKCSPPTPDNIMKKSAFSLPGGCSSISGCSEYCMNPVNTQQCAEFCGNFPSLCQNLNEIRAESAPDECKSCTACNAKECILDCNYRCYKYLPIPSEDVAALKEGATFERKYSQPIKAVWEPGPAYNRIGVTYFTEDYKEMGVNTYSIIPKYTHKEGTLTHTVDHATGEEADKEKIANIIKAKKAGLQVVLVAHDLYDMFPDVTGKKGGIKFEEYYDDVEATALKWAKIAEQYQVEYFAPVSEFEYVLYENGYPAEEACTITNSLYKKIIPKVRETFKGKVYCRVGGMGGKFGCMDFSQCDIFGFTYGFEGGNPKANFESSFKEAELLYSKYRKPYIMAEAFMLVIQGNTMEDCISLHKAGMQAYKDVATNAIGYTFMGLIQRDPVSKNDCPITGTELVGKYRDFFSSMN